MSAADERVGGAGTVVFQEGRRLALTVRIPYAPTEWALLQGVFPMSEEAWDAMMEVLNEMKRGLVSPESALQRTTPAPKVVGGTGIHSPSELGAVLRPPTPEGDARDG